MTARYHIDTDMGVDDSLAIVVAAQVLGANLAAVSTVFGNIPVRLATRNAFILRELLNPPRKFDIFEGAECASDGFFRDARHIHGEDGLGGATAALGHDVLRRIGDEAHSAEVGRVDQIHKSNQKVIIVGLGPATNITRLVESYGTQNIERIVLMTGAFFDNGNITPYAEFNAHCDPFALRSLLELGVPMTLVPLDVCRKVQLLRSTVRSYLDQRPSKLTSLIVAAHMKYMDFYNDWEGIDGCFPHDTVALLAAVRPEWFYSVRARIQVECATERRGKTSLTLDESPSVSVVFGGALKNVRELLRTLQVSIDQPREVRAMIARATGY
jgi:inosine-uridine nucleoside N-ribohydrolase